MRLIDADQLCEEFKMRQRAALNWKEGATLANNEESIIRADATLAFLSEVKLTIDNAPTVEITEEQAIDKLHETGWLPRHDKEMTVRPQGYEDARQDYMKPNASWVGSKSSASRITCTGCGISVDYTKIDFVLRYCPNCGAIMTHYEEDDDE